MNVWKQFQNLLPKDPVLIATVDSHNIDGTSTVTFLSGGSAIVYGQDVALNSKAFIQTNRIIGDAPDLTHYEFEV